MNINWKNKYNLIESVLNITASVLMVIGVYVLMGQAFSLFSLQGLLITLLVSAAEAFLIEHFSKYSFKFTFIILLCLIAIVIMKFNNFINAGTAYLGNIVTKYNVYYKTNYYAPSGVKNDYLGLALIIIIIALIASVIISRTRSKVLYFLFVIVFCLPSIICGAIPDMITGIFCFLTAFFAFNVQIKGNRNNKFVLFRTGVVIVFCLVGVICSPIVKGHIERNKVALEEKRINVSRMQINLKKGKFDAAYNDFLKAVGLYSYDHGNIAAMGNREIKNKDELEVSCEKKHLVGDVYLRGYTAENYLNQRWETKTDKQLSEYLNRDVSVKNIDLAEIMRFLYKKNLCEYAEEHKDERDELYSMYEYDNGDDYYGDYIVYEQWLKDEGIQEEDYDYFDWYDEYIIDGEYAYYIATKNKQAMSFSVSDMKTALNGYLYYLTIGADKENQNSLSDWYYGTGIYSDLSIGIKNIEADGRYMYAADCCAVPKQMIINGSMVEAEGNENYSQNIIESGNMDDDYWNWISGDYNLRMYLFNPGMFGYEDIITLADYLKSPHSIPIIKDMSKKANRFNTFDWNKMSEYIGSNYSRDTKEGDYFDSISDSKKNMLEDNFDISIEYLKALNEKVFPYHYDKDEAIDSFIKENKLDSLEKIEDVIYELRKIYLHQFAYSLTPNIDSDHVMDDFLENKKGYCVHFATLTTLVLQRLGYNARYCSGYYFRGDDFTQNDKGEYIYRLTDNNAHAWCEYYKKGVWTKADLTPGYFGIGVHNATEAQERQDRVGVPKVTTEQTTTSQSATGNVQRESSSNQSVTGRNNETTKQINDKGQNQTGTNEGGNAKTNKSSKINKPKDNSIQFLLFLTNIFFVSLFVYFIIWLQMKLRILIRFRKFNSADKRIGIRNIYAAVMNICRFEERECLKFDASMISEEHIKRFSGLSKKEWERVYNISLAAAFSDRVPSKDDYKEIYYLYRKFRKKTLASYKNKRLRKIIFKYILAY